MTFAARSTGASLHAVVANPLATLAVRDVKPFISASASVTFGSAGTITFTGNQSSAATAWITPTGAGVGADYWVRFTLSSGSPWDAGLTSGALNSLASSRALVWSASASTSKTAVVSVQIYSDAAGAQLVTSGTLNVYSSGMN